jgi:preprotein translocase subunit SecE
MAAKNKSKSKLKFFKEVRAEMKKVKWPNREELTKATGVVLATVIAFALAMVLVDSIFSQLLRIFI